MYKLTMEFKSKKRIDAVKKALEKHFCLNDVYAEAKIDKKIECSSTDCHKCIGKLNLRIEG